MEKNGEPTGKEIMTSYGKENFVRFETSTNIHPLQPNKRITKNLTLSEEFIETFIQIIFPPKK